MRYISSNSSSLIIISASFEKSGPFIILSSSFKVDFGLSNRRTAASMISFILCDGISVAIPTAIPDVPLSKIIGTFEGKITGSNKEPSKFGCQSTVPDFSSEISKFAKLVNLDSVYLIAANDFGSS